MPSPSPTGRTRGKGESPPLRINLMNNFIYHRVVDNMQGSILYPLNQLKNIFPDEFAEHIKKYENREHLLSTKIPLLDCLWNDVLHFTTVHPNVLFENLSRAGYDAEELVWRRWFEIPIDRLDPKNTLVCLYCRDTDLIPQARDFFPFDSSKLYEYATVPPETIEYYKKQKKIGARPLLFHRVPYILYKGIIDTSAFKVIGL